MRDVRYSWRTLVRELGFACLGLAFLIPVFLLISGSLKSDSETVTDPVGLPSAVDLGSYSVAWESGQPIPLSQALVNSAIITGGSVLAVVAIGSLCAYVVARRPSRFSTSVYVFFLISIIVPVQLGIVPLFVAMRHVHLTGNHFGMIVLYTGLMMPLAAFLYTGFVRALPRDYEEAAQVDGAGPVRVFCEVVFPLLRPVTGTVAILTGLLVWNDFFAPLIFLGGSRVQTVPVALYSLVGEYEEQWNQIFAAIVIAVIPILLVAVVAQRQLIRGFTSGVRS